MYNATILELFQQPYHMQDLPDADVVGQVGIEGEGPYMTVYLRLLDRQIQQASFETYGCPSAIACGSWVARWVEGKSVEEVLVLGPDELSLVLGGLPLGKEHCAGLAVGALRSAIEQLSLPEQPQDGA